MGLLLTGVCVASGQGPGPDKEKDAKPAPKSKLEEMLSQAIKNNPDILVARAKQDAAKARLSEADAEVNRAVLQVAQKVTSLYKAVEEQRELLAAAEEKIKRDVNRTEAANERFRAKAKLAELETELTYVLGKPPSGAADTLRVSYTDTACVKCHQNPFPGADIDDKTLEWAHQHIVRYTPEQKRVTKGPLAEKLRKALDMPVKVDYQAKTLEVILKDLLGKFEGVPVVYKIVQNTPVERGLCEVVDLQLTEELSLGAAVQLLQDRLHPNLRILVRDYGLLVTELSTSEKLPPGAVTLHDFWKGAAKDRAKGGDDRKPGTE
jgi:hypothetical protein